MGKLRAAPRSGGRLAEHLRACRARRCPSCSRRAQALPRTLLGEDSERAKKFEQSVDKFWRQHRDVARAGRSLSPVYPGAGLHLSRPQHPRALQVAHARRRAQASVRARADRLGDYWINVHVPGLRRHIFRSSICIPAAAPAPRARHRTLIEMLGPRRRADMARGPHWSRVSRRASALRSATANCATVRIAPACCSGCRGVKPGDRVLLIGENSPDWVLAYLLDPFRRRGRGAAGSSDLARRVGADLPHRHALARRCFPRPLQAPGRRTARSRRAKSSNSNSPSSARPFVLQRRRDTRHPSSSARRWPQSFSPPAPPARPRA